MKNHVELKLSKNANKLLAYLLTKPNDWQIQLKNLAIKLLPEEPEKIDLALNELTQASYINQVISDDDIWLHNAEIKVVNSRTPLNKSFSVEFPKKISGHIQALTTDVLKSMSGILTHKEYSHV